MNESKLEYVGFWKRLAAFLLDTIIFLPLVILISHLAPKFRLFYAYYFVPCMILTFFYSIYLVKHYGGTPGKLLAGIQITKVDGTPVGYREAFLRCAPEIIFWILTAIGIILITLQMTDVEYTSLSPHERHVRLHGQPWISWVEMASQVWMWSEFIVLLTNKKKRALHDFLAGTVVIKKVPAKHC